MEIHEILSEIRKKRGVKIIDLHNTITKLFGNNSLCYRTLLRILYGQTRPHDATLHQICIALNTTPAEVHAKMVEGQEMATVFTKRSLRKRRFVYNQKAYADVLSGPERKFSIMELTLLKDGVTRIERRSEKKDISEAWVYGVRSVTTCKVGDREFTVKKGDCVAFDCNLEHAFINKSPRKSQCLIIQSNG